MKKDRKTKKALELKMTTLRVLTAEKLATVVGGAGTYACTTGSCPASCGQISVGQ